MTPLQAVIFTHCNRLRYDDSNDPTFFSNNKNRFIENYAESFQKYLKCNEDQILIRVVYAYVDIGIKDAIPSAGGRFQLSPDMIKKELMLKGVLQLAEDRARRRLEWMNKPPEFRFVGLIELVELLSNLTEVNQNLMKALCGPNNEWTYDSPKFVEAVIRLARGDIPHLAKNPIIRVDDDADVNPAAIQLLLTQFEDVSHQTPFYFFSGKYGRGDGKYDPVNDYAVRTHWFFPVGTLDGDDRFESDPSFKACTDVAETFLADLAVLGARQPLSHNHKQSKKLVELHAQGIVNTKPRVYPQVISGAGLIMARRNIALLPPFMNFKNLITWVDDHLKRELHEMLGDIAPADIQSVTSATFEQNRHSRPDGITQKDIDDTKNGWYFIRLLEGCILSSMIADETGTLNYSGLIRDIVKYRIEKFDFSQQEQTQLTKQLQRVGLDRYNLVLQCWTSDEFKRTSLYNWACDQLSKDQKSVNSNSSYMPPLVDAVVADAVNYIYLLFDWHKFTRAIERLAFTGNLWLYR